jgi:hypothetical protein
MGKLFESASNQGGNATGRKASPIMQGLGSGLTDGFDAYDQSRQCINASGRGGTSLAVRNQGVAVPPSTDFLTQARARFTPPGSAFYGS